MTSQTTFPWVYKSDEKEPFPEREFYQEVERSYGDWGGIYNARGEPVVGCNEYMVFKDHETAEFIVKAVNFYMEHHND